MAAWSAARTAWPELPDDRERFACYLAEHVGNGSLANVRAADLQLALHCRDGSAKAIEAFLAGPFRAARATLLKIRYPLPIIDEVEQQLRVMLLAPPQPKIGNYGGRGDLRNWVASVAARTAHKRVQAEQRRPDAPGDDALLDQPAADDDPELIYFKDAYREEFASAVRDALVRLSVRQRNLLRQHHLDRLTLDDLATLYDAHRATVARWLAAARDQVAAQTRALLHERLALDEEEFASVVRLVASQIQVSIARVLAS